jgi:hypothetical protein
MTALASWMDAVRLVAIMTSTWSSVRSSAALKTPKPALNTTASTRCRWVPLLRPRTWLLLAVALPLARCLFIVSL